MTTTYFDFQHSAGFAPEAAEASASKQATRACKTLINQLEPDLLQLGDTGAGVKSLQAVLQALSLYSGLNDGYFGPKTEAATQKLQAALEIDINGIFDQATWYALSFWLP